ncbi:MAG: right-handed parallel beta-helix repeat-containing protein, partial [Actinomycetota bacterium]
MSNTISGNFGNGLNLSLSGGGGVSASGITGNAIWGNGGVGVLVNGNSPPVLTLSGNDIYQNTNYELRNDGGSAVVANGNYWGSSTTTELGQGKANITRIYDIRDGGQQQALIAQWYAAPVLGGSPGALQNLTYPAAGGAQIVSGTIDTAQTWSGTVLVVGDVTVVGSLTIAQGTTVLFDSLHDAQAGGSDRSRCELIVNGGSLTIAGTGLAPVRLTSAGVSKAAGNWYGVRVMKGDVSLNNCVIEYAVDGLRLEDTDTRFAVYSLANVTVQRCSGNGVFTTSGQNAQMVVLNNFQLGTNATGLTANGPTTLNGGQVVGNTGYGIFVNNTGAALVLTGTVVNNNQGDGVQAYGSLQMNGCTVARNNGWGLQLYPQNSSLSVEIGNSLVQSNGSG